MRRDERVTDDMVLAHAKEDAIFAGTEFGALGRADRTRYLERSRRCLSAALSIEQTQPDASEWHRTDRPGGASVLLYTLREEGWRRGEAVLVNDVMVNIDRAHCSETDIEPIVQRILSALVNAQADADVVERWQPIETAPKDGTNILVWAEGYSWPEVVRYIQYDAPHLEEETGEPGYWRYSDDVFSDILQIEDGDFTHWRPLPAPPATRIADSAEAGGSATSSSGGDHG